jgi:hypothetical protein
VSVAAGDLHVKVGSPAIDAGVSVAVVSNDFYYTQRRRDLRLTLVPSK